MKVIKKEKLIRDIAKQTNNNIADVKVVYNTLESNGIHVEMASCSEINISCYIDRNDVNDAQVLLHEAFIENNEEE